MDDGPVKKKRDLHWSLAIEIDEANHIHRDLTPHHFPQTLVRGNYYNWNKKGVLVDILRNSPHQNNFQTLEKNPRWSLWRKCCWGATNRLKLPQDELLHKQHNQECQGKTLDHVQCTLNIAGDMLFPLQEFYSEINGSTLTGAIDVVVVEQEDGTFKSSPFHVRFGKMGVLKAKEKIVSASNSNS